MANRSNIMGFHGIKNKTSRNSFDLSHRNLFSAKVGELLPCAVFELNPGDTINLDCSYFTRTAPLQSAAFTRLRENVQFFFVPYSQLWHYFESQVLNMTKTAAGGDVSRIATDMTSNQKVTTQMPFVSYTALHQYLQNLINYAGDKSDGSDTNPQLLNNGEFRWCASAKLLQLLGYGNFPEQVMTPDTGKSKFNSSDIKNPLNMSVFRLLAYQKVCNDHYTFKQWQPYDASLCNIDYLVPNNSSALDLSSKLTSLRLGSNLEKLNLCDLRFSNLPLDYLNGVLPTSQFGSESVVNLSSSGSGNISFHGSTNYQHVTYDGTKLFDRGTHEGVGRQNFSEIRTDSDSNLIFNVGTSPDESWKTGVIITNHTHPISGTGSVSGLSSSLSILALRQATALQKYKEIQLANDVDFVSQIEAHFGIKPDNSDNVSYFIGGSSSMIDINPQVNSSLSGDNVADVKAAPVGNGSSKMKYTAKTYGVVIGIYRCTPVLDYAHVGIDRTLLKTDASDFVIPELDSIGMQQNLISEIAAPSGYNDTAMLANVPMTQTYGYVPRYAEYKTSFDRTNGIFNFTMNDWVTGLDTKRIYQLINDYGSVTDKSLIATELFNCYPSLCDSIFVDQRNLTTNHDKLFVGMVNMAYVTRNLSRYGLPYCN
nr:major head protein [Microvirus sp.]